MRKRAQSINDYALVIVLVTLAGIGMQSYIKRGIQAVIKGTADVLAAGGVQPPAPVPAADILNPMDLSPDYILADGSYYGINFSKFWHPAFIKEYIEGEWGYLGATLLKDTEGKYKKNINGNYIVSYLPAACIIEMVKDGNDVYYRFHPSDSESPVTVARENATTHDLIIYYTSDPKRRPPNATFNSKGNPALPYNDAIAQQKGIIEPGLVKLEYTLPVKIAANKNIKVDTLSSGQIGLSKDDWHLQMKEYQKRMDEYSIPGFIQIEIKGNNVYYYLLNTNSKECIGGEDFRTHDFTSFDQGGFPYQTVDTYRNELRAYGRYVEDPQTKAVGVVADDCQQVPLTNCRIYGQYEIVTITPIPSDAPSPTAAPIRTKTINQDTVQVTGAWTATYKLENAGALSALEKQKAAVKDKNPALPN